MRFAAYFVFLTLLFAAPGKAQDPSEGPVAAEGESPLDMEFAVPAPPELVLDPNLFPTLDPDSLMTPVPAPGISDNAFAPDEENPDDEGLNAADLDDEDPVTGGAPPPPVSSPPAPATTQEAKTLPDDATGSQASAGPAPDLPIDGVVSLQALTGRWVSGDPGFTLAIIPERDAGPRNKVIEGHTDRRVWKGRYIGRPEPIIAQLFYTPRAEEMDKTIPLWARRIVEGEVRWRLDLIPVGRLHSPRLKARWDRKQVQWDTAGKTAKVVDAGEPVEYMLDYAPLLQVSQYGSTRVDLLPGGPLGEKENPPSLLGLLQHQAFYAAIHMPERDAKTTGGSLTVSIRGLSSGAVQKLALTAGAPEAGVVRYTHDRPVALGDCSTRPDYRPPVMSLEWIGSLITDGASLGACLPFEGQDGELVEIRFGDAAYRVQYFSSWTQAMLARQRDKIEFYRTIFNAVVTSDRATSAARLAARQSLLLIRNYDALMLMEVEGSPLTDLHKVAIGEIYLGGANGPTYYLKPRSEFRRVSSGKGLILYTEEDIGIAQTAYEAKLDFGSSTMWGDALKFHGGADLGRKAADASILARNVVWQLCNGAATTRPDPDQSRDAQLRQMRAMSCFEQKVVYSALKHVGTQALNNISEEFFTGVALTLYETSAYVSPAGDLYTLATGDDIYGKKVSNFEYWLNAAGVALDGFGLVMGANDLFEVIDARRMLKSKGGQILDSAGAVVDAPLSRQVLGRGRGRPLVRVASAAAEGAGDAAGQVLPDLARVADLPGSLSDGQRRRLAQRLKPVETSLKASDLPDAPARLELRFAARRAPVDRDVVRLQSELVAEYGDGAGLPQLDGGANFRPSAGAANYDAVAANYMIWRATGRLASEADGVRALRGALSDAVAGNRTFQARAPALGVTTRMPEPVLNRRLQAAGMEMSRIDPALSRGLAPKDVKAALDRGWIVETRLKIDGAIRPVIIEDVLVDTTGTPTKVRLFDPKYGRMVDVDAGVFDGLVLRDGNTPNFKLGRATDPDLAPRATPFGFTTTPPRFASWDAKPARSRRAAANTIFEFTTTQDQKMVVRLGDAFSEGQTNALYTLPDFPDQVARITKPGATANEIASDLFGRVALQDQRLNRGYIDAPKQRGVYRFYAGGNLDPKNARVIEIVDRFKGTEARKLLKNGAGDRIPMTRGQALALEAATRELNKAGYVWTDGHPGNFAFEKLSGADRWRIRVFDPGGIFPATGDTATVRAARARAMQRGIQIPDALALRFWNKGNENLAVDVARNTFIEDFGRFINQRRLGADTANLPVTPRIGLAHPVMREIFDLSDARLRLEIGAR